MMRWRWRVVFLMCLLARASDAAWPVWPTDTGLLTNGLATTGGSGTTLNAATGDDFTAAGITVNRHIVLNTTDGSQCTITSVTDSNTLVCSGGLTGGSVNTFADGDTYEVRNPTDSIVGQDWNRARDAALNIADTTDSTTFVALYESATGIQSPKTDAGLTYDASTATVGVGGLAISGDSGFITFDPATSLESQWWMGVNHDAGVDNNDPWELRESATPGVNVRLIIPTGGCAEGNILKTASGALTCGNDEIATFTDSDGLSLALDDETGAGLAVFNNSPELLTPNLTLEDGNVAAPTSDGRIKHNRATESLEVGDGSGTNRYPPAGTLVDGQQCAWNGTTQKYDCNLTPPAPDFNSIGTGNNSTATMTVSGAASIVPSDTGVVEANRASNPLEIGTCGAGCADAGNVRMAHGGTIAARNQANSGNVTFGLISTTDVWGQTGGGLEATQVPSGTNPTVDSAGEAAVDTTAGQFVFYNGSAARVATDLLTKCMTIESPTDADNFLFFRASRGLTVTGIDCVVHAATSAVITVQECNGNGTTCGTTEAAMTCTTTNTTEAAGIDDATVDTGDWLRIDVGAVTGTVGQVSVCMEYTETRQ